SSIADGAAALMVMSEAKRKAMGLRGGARILGYADVAVGPGGVTVAPGHGVRQRGDHASAPLCGHAIVGRKEGAAATVPAAMKELSLPHEKVNVFGGAVALGHPIGTSGARILITLMNALRVRKGRIGIATACIGGGEAAAMAIERLD